jgi:hypothetical protein
LKVKKQFVQVAVDLLKGENLWPKKKNALIRLATAWRLRTVSIAASIAGMRPARWN